MIQIALVASVYHQDHQVFPERLSQLIPDYVSETDIFYFHCKYGAKFDPPGGSKDPKLIDVFSPYELRTLSDGGAMVFERAPIWPESIGYCLIRGKTVDGKTESPFGPADGAGHRMSREEFASRFSKLFQP